MYAFHNDPAVKAKYLNRVNQHIAADALIRGTGWDGKKGCAVGCTLEAYNHARYPIELGIPEWLAQVEDTLFEGMSEEKSRTWPRVFLEAIEPGMDLEAVKAPFIRLILQSTLATFDHAEYPTVKEAIDGSIALWSRDDIGSDKWIRDAEAARAAAGAARAAAWAARAAAWAARAAAGAARAAAGAARAAAWAARAAAWAAAGAAEAAKYDEFADKLIKLIREVPVQGEAA